MALGGVWGCAPDPALVYVDLDQAAALVVAPVEAQVAVGQEALGSEQAIPDLEQRGLFIGSAAERATEALEIYRQTQEKAAKAVLDRLEKAYALEVDRAERTARAEAAQGYDERLEAMIASLHDVFVDHAEKVGELRYELDRLVGFPDPDPKSLRVPRTSDAQATKRFNDAKAVRDAIQALDDQFRTEVQSRVDALSAAHLLRLNQIGVDADADRRLALERAHRDADALAQDALVLLETTALDPNAQLAAVPGAESSVNSGPVAGRPIAKGADTAETREDLEAQLEVFIKVYRYRLSTRPSEGRDVTQEFLQWRRNYMVGR